MVDRNADTSDKKQAEPPHALRNAAIELFNGDREAASDWLNKTSPGLGHRTPLEVAKTKEGLSEVLDLITQIEHGVYR